MKITPDGEANQEVPSLPPFLRSSGDAQARIDLSTMMSDSPQPKASGIPRPPLVFINQEPIFQWFGPVMLLGTGAVVGVMGVRALFVPDPSPATVTVAGAFSAGFLSAGIAYARHIRRGRHRRITIDYDSRTIRLENFRIFNSFFSGFRAIPVQIIPFSDLLGTTKVRNPRTADQLHISLRGGRIIINEHFCDFRLLQSALEEIASETPPPPFRHTVAFHWVAAVGLLLFTLLLLYVAHLTGLLGAFLDFAHSVR